MTLDEHIRKIVAEELAKHQSSADIVPVAEFCKVKNIHRNTVWRAEKEGRIKLIRLGKKVFINPQQFIV